MIETTSTTNRKAIPEMKTANDIIKAYPEMGLHVWGIKTLAKEGKVKTAKFGKRTYINVQSLFDYLNGVNE